MSVNPHRSDPMMTTAPVAWCLAWKEDGELAAQDRFDLLQSLVRSESVEVQAGLIAAVERVTLMDISVMASGEVTRLCA